MGQATEGSASTLASGGATVWRKSLANPAARIAPLRLMNAQRFLTATKTVWAFLAGATTLERFLPSLSIPVIKRRAQDPLNFSRTFAEAGMRLFAISLPI